MEIVIHQSYTLIDKVPETVQNVPVQGLTLLTLRLVLPMTSIGLGKRNFRSGGYGVATNNGDGEDHHHLILQSGGARYL